MVDRCVRETYLCSADLCIIASTLITRADRKKNALRQLTYNIEKGMAGIDLRKLETSLNVVAIRRLAERGCPQGGVLSQFLWILVVDFVISILSTAGFEVQGMADDLAILVNGRQLFL